MICAIVLAAGRSRRMGAQKLLLPLDGQPIIARIVEEVLRGPVDRAIVVIGPDGRGIRTALAGRSVHFVTNPDPESEMLESVRCGWRALAMNRLPVAAYRAENIAAALIVLGDQPGLTAGVIACLVQAFRTTGRGIVAPVHEGRRGHPLLVAARYGEEILTRYDETGLRGLLQAHCEDVLEVAAGTPVVLEDMDEPEDYERLAGLTKTAKPRARPPKDRAGGS
jgi:molybdenum cofactor cytidylyltransferase